MSRYIASVSVKSHPNLAGLIAAVTAALSANVQPIGAPYQDNGVWNWPLATSTPEQIAYAADGALANDDTTAVLTKGSAGAYTLAAPTADGLRKRIINGTAFAHVITATNLLDDGVTGGAKDTATFGAFVGAVLDLESYNGKWVVASKNVVTIAAV